MDAIVEIIVVALAAIVSVLLGKKPLLWLANRSSARLRSLQPTLSEPSVGKL